MTEAKKKPGFFKRSQIIIILALPALVIIFSFMINRSCVHKFVQLDVLGEIPQFTATTIEGKTVTNASFKGETIIYTTLQMSCPKDCGINFWFMYQHLFKYIRSHRFENPDVKIVSIVEGRNGELATHQDLADMEAILRDNVQDYDPQFWMVISGDPTKLYDIIKKGKSLKDVDGEEFVNGKAYNSTLLLADKDNQLRMMMRGDKEGTVRTMGQHLQLLLKEYSSKK